MKKKVVRKKDSVKSNSKTEKKSDKKTSRTKKIVLAICLVAGIFLFLYFLIEFGQSAAILITQNFNFKYLGIYIFLTLFAFFPITWRFQTILSAYNEKPSFWILLKQAIATYSVSYVTPVARIGGEPLRAFMLQKECGVDYKTGSSAILIDKFVEFAGSAILGVLGLFVILFVPGVPLVLKVAFIVVLGIALFVVIGFYIRTINDKGSLSTTFRFARLHKIKNWHDFPEVIEDVEKMIGKFFKEHKKPLFISACFYGITGAIYFFELKYLLLSFGIAASFIEIIIAINIWGLVNFLPVPAGIGFLEASQSSLFQALKGDGSIGFAFSLMTRARALFVVAIGFLLITQFSGKEIIKKYKEESGKKEAF